jgi:antirestriction protein ArdC
MTQPSPFPSVAASGAPLRADVYARVTDRIVEDLARGVRPWAKPWAASAGQERARITLPLRSNGTPYRGVNVLLLWGAALDGGFSSPMWMTYRQAQELGGQVRKGETGSLVVFANRVTKTETGDDGADVEREIPVMKGYTVFNVEQIDGLPDRYRPRPAPLPDAGEPVAPGAPAIEPHAVAEAFFAETGADFRHGGVQAFYVPARDLIQLPPVAAFRDAEAYAATKAHELVHWTGHPSRNARVFGKRFGDHAYAFEELVAELGAAFLCAYLGVTPEIREDHAAYLAHWLQVLQQDKRAIFTAATHAQRAVDYLQGLQAPQTQEHGDGLAVPA